MNSSGTCTCTFIWRTIFCSRGPSGWKQGSVRRGFMLRDPGLIPLSRDHHHALALCVFTERALAADGSPTGVAAAARRIVQKFDSEIRGHFEFEEQVLFPAFHGIPSTGTLIAELLAEHRRMVAL